MIIEKKNKALLQNAIDKKWKQMGLERFCNLTADYMIGRTEKFKDFLNDINRTVVNYEGAEILCEEIEKDGELSGRKCLNFKMKIINGQFHLVDLFSGEITCRAKNMIVSLFPQMEREKEDCDYWYGEAHGVKIRIYKSMARLRLPDLPADFDYRIGSFDEIYQIIESFTKELNPVRKKNLLKKLENHYNSKVQPYQRKVKIQNTLGV